MVQVIKANGQREEFSEEKVRRSIQHARIPDELQNQVLQHVKTKLHNDIKTSEIYKHITEFLGQSHSPYLQSRYSLKESIMALGPTGYPFEDYVSEILKSQDYKTEVRVIVSGICIRHEIDIIAQKQLIDIDKKIMIEAKFHNGFGIKTDVQDALYTKARFDDVKEKNDFSNVWLVTNTKATIDTIQYCECVGMKIIAWNYPEGDCLRDLVNKSSLAPITSLTTLSGAQKQQLLENHVVLCKDVHPSSIDLLNLPPDKKNQVLTEAEFIYKP